MRWSICKGRGPGAEGRGSGAGLCPAAVSQVGEALFSEAVPQVGGMSFSEAVSQVGEASFAVFVPPLGEASIAVPFAKRVTLGRAGMLLGIKIPSFLMIKEQLFHVR